MQLLFSTSKISFTLSRFLPCSHPQSLEVESGRAGCNPDRSRDALDDLLRLAVNLNWFWGSLGLYKSLLGGGWLVGGIGPGLD